MRIVLPNKGSLAKGTIDLMLASGYKCKRSSKELVCYDQTHDVEFIFLRPKDIPTYVDANIFTLGITGRDIVMDSHFSLEEILPLGFGKSSMRYIIPKENKFTNIQQLHNKNIACSYPHFLKNHLASEGIEANIIKLEGAVEIAIHLGIADVIVDVVETGTTIKEAGLKAVGEPIIHSEAVLVSKVPLKKLSEDAKLMVLRLQGIITAKNYVMIEYDIKQEKLQEACAICSGIHSPTVTRLHNEGWLSVKVMAKSSQQNSIIDEFYRLGAKGIIVTPINNCRI